VVGQWRRGRFNGFWRLKREQFLGSETIAKATNTKAKNLKAKSKS